MKYQPDIHHRRSIRLKDYDYSQVNAYFVTICVQNKQHLFGEIRGEKMLLNHAGSMAKRWYEELESKSTNLQCDEFICMPNHIHFITHITENPVGADLCVRPDEPVRPEYQSGQDEPGQTHRSEKPGQTHRSAPTGGANVPAIVQWYKTMITNEYIRGVKQDGWQPFSGKLWQRNYWERVIRDENELNHIREYIKTNPICWEQDKLFTNHQPPVGADLRVRPNERALPDHGRSFVIENEQMCRCEKPGQTHRSAPTGEKL